MAKRYKNQRLDSSLFHHGLIRIMLVHQLKLQNDDWDSFLTINGFISPNAEKVDKPVIEETFVYPTTLPSSTQACVMASHNKPLPDPKIAEQAREQVAQPNDFVKNSKRPTCKMSKGDVYLGFKNKRYVRLISRKLWNKSKPHVSSIKMIEIHESSDSEIDRFLAEEDPLSFRIDLDQPYKFIDNLPPCLKHSEGFPGIKLGNKSTVHVGDILVHNHGNSQVNVAQP